LITSFSYEYDYYYFFVTTLEEIPKVWYKSYEEIPKVWKTFCEGKNNRIKYETKKSITDI